ncbi:MAG: hypothetical protein ABJC74_12430 [Gemmatimonadota bacterium]
MMGMRYDPKRLTGFSQRELATGFERVSNPHDWKGSIRAEIAVVDRERTRAAVTWFTGTVAEFTPVPDHADRLTVRAAGYRMGPSGDGYLTVWGSRGELSPW